MVYRMWILTSFFVFSTLIGVEILHAEDVPHLYVDLNAGYSLYVASDLNGGEGNGFGLNLGYRFVPRFAAQISYLGAIVDGEGGLISKVEMDQVHFLTVGGRVSFWPGTKDRHEVFSLLGMGMGWVYGKEGGQSFSKSGFAVRWDIGYLYHLSDDFGVGVSYDAQVATSLLDIDQDGENEVGILQSFLWVGTYKF
ncbi:MAG: outer membrane beta-barrel protein [Deltaproteobacteria bacterium]|nr:outer membrane beta-barrel protein [Deltaproteobacteria bacterium]